MKSNKRKGFTLVELLVVIAILAILSTVAVVGYTSYIEGAYVSNDQMLATQITHALEAYKVNGSVTNENELKAAIADFFGEDYLEKMEPQSAQYGYHFWYDIEKGEVIAAKPKDLGLDGLMRPFWRNPASAEEGTEPDYSSFAFGSFRIFGKYYLLDRANEHSAVVNAINTLEKPDMTADEYASVLTGLNVGADEAKLQAELVKNLNKIAIANETGMHVNGDGTAVTHVYIPTPAKGDEDGYTIGSTGSVALPNVKAPLTLPAGVKVGSNALISIGNLTDDTALKENTTEIHVNLTEEQLKDYFYTSSTNCVIVLPNGDRYIVKGSEIVKLTAEGESSVGTTEFSNPVKSFTVSGSGTNFVSGVISFDNIKNGDTFTLVADNFVGENGGEPSDKTVTWSTESDFCKVDPATGVVTITDVSKIKYNNNTATIEATAKAGGQTAPYTIQVNFLTMATLSGFDSDVTVDRTPNTKADGTYENAGKISIEYGKNNNFTSEFTVALKGTPIKVVPGDDFVVDSTVELIAGAGDLFEISADKKTLKLKVDANGDMNIDTDNNTQLLTIKVGHLEETFEVTVTDAISNPIDYKYVINENIGTEASPIMVQTQVNDYLFRVGNMTAFTLDKLFTLSDNNATLSVTIRDRLTKDENGDYSVMSNSGTFNVTTSGSGMATSIDFGGTGIAIIEVTATYTDATNNKTRSYTQSMVVEVVDAQNISGAVTTLPTKSVLLGDVTLTTAQSISNGVLYGNGYKIDATSYHAANNGMISISNNTVIDHVRIIGAYFDTFANGSSQDYYNSLVLATGGNCTISNSYIRGTRSPVRMIGINTELTIKNTTLDGGTIANLHVENGVCVTLDNVTTIQAVRNDLLGIGIYFDQDSVENTKLVIKNNFKQYNWMSAGEVQYLPDEVESVVSKLFETNSEYSAAQHNVNGVIKVNTSIVYAGTPDDSNFDISNMTANTVTFARYSQSGAVFRTVTNENDYVKSTYTIPNRSDLTYSGQLVQGATEPEYTFNTTDNYVANAGDGTSYYEYKDGKISIGYVIGSTVEVDFNRVTVTKYGQSITSAVDIYIVYIDANGNIVEELLTDGKYTFNSGSSLGAGEYKIVYKYSDPYQYDSAGKQMDSVEWSNEIAITVAEINNQANDPSFSFSGLGTTTIVQGTDGNYYANPAIPSGTASTKYSSMTVGGQTIYYPIVEGTQVKGGLLDSGSLYRYYSIFAGITIQDYSVGSTADPNKLYNTNTTTMPSDLSWVYSKLISGKADKGGEITNRTATTDTYSDVNGQLAYKTGSLNFSSTGADIPETTVVLGFKYHSTNGKDIYYYIGYHFEKQAKQTSSSCVTPETLVTLADGTQKEIQYATYEDELLVWNFYTGEYTTVPASMLFRHDEGMYTIITMNFEDGSFLEVAEEHGVFDATLNEFVFINAENVSDYVGHTFIKQNGDGFAEVRMVDYEVEVRNTAVYSVLSDAYFNCFLNDLLTLTPIPGYDNFFMPFDLNDNMIFDIEEIQADIETYGLCDYDAFANKMDKDLFSALNMQYFYISEAKGLITEEGILYLVDLINQFKVQ